MRRSYSSMLCLLLTLAGAPLAAGPGQQDEKYYLKDKVAAGDVADISEEMKMTMHVRASAEGGESPDMPALNHRQASYKMTVLSVGPKDQMTGARVRFSRSRSAMQMIGGKLKSTASSAEGKTVTIKRVNGKTVVTADHGQISAADRAELAGMLGSNDKVGSPIPTDGLYLGEDWSFNSEKIAKAFGFTGNAGVNGRLAEKVERAGHPCLRAELHIEITGRPKGLPVDVTMKFDGDVYYATDIHRTVEVSLAGPVTLSGEVPQGGRTVFLAGDGTSKFTYSAKWKTAGAKPAKP